jgi:hypothetical protein
MLTRKNMRNTRTIRILSFLTFFIIFLIGLYTGLIMKDIPKMILVLTWSLTSFLSFISTFPIFSIDDSLQRILSQMPDKSDLRQNSTTMPSNRICFQNRRFKIAQDISSTIGPAFILLSGILWLFYPDTLIMIICMFSAIVLCLIFRSIFWAVKIESCFAQLEELISGLEMKQIKKE